jgi:hypothetical protein
MADGARDALSGYLYQFLGAAGLIARARNSADDHAADAGGLEVSARRGSVVHEQADMDVVVRSAGESNAVGVQFKYSRSTPPRAIEGSELIEILDAFHRSSTQPEALLFTKFVLISNRPFAASAQLLYATRGQVSPDVALIPEESRGKRRAKKPSKAVELYGGADRAASTRQEILSKLLTELNVRQDVWTDDVRTYASRHGVLTPEFDGALSRLVGEILRRTIGRPLELTTEFLNECLLGAADARSLAVDGGAGSAHVAAGEALSDFISSPCLG